MLADMLRTAIQRWLAGTGASIAAVDLAFREASAVLPSRPMEARP